MIYVLLSVIGYWYFHIKTIIFIFTGLIVNNFIITEYLVEIIVIIKDIFIFYLCIYLYVLHII